MNDVEDLDDMLNVDGNHDDDDDLIGRGYAGESCLRFSASLSFMITKMAIHKQKKKKRIIVVKSTDKESCQNTFIIKPRKRKNATVDISFCLFLLLITTNVHILLMQKYQ